MRMGEYPGVACRERHVRMTSHDVSESIPMLSGSIGSWRLSLSRTPRAAFDLGRQYDAKAKRWSSRLERMGVHAAYRECWRALLDEQLNLPLGRAIRVLDCGVGDGAFSRAFCTVWSGGLDLHGVDVSEVMLTEARSRLEAVGVHATLWRSDACDLPFEDGFFDLVFSAHMLEHLPSPQRALSETRRVLARGGAAGAVVTRRSAPGRLVQVRWRTHVFDPRQAGRLMAESGFDSLGCLPPTGRSIFDSLSLTCYGRKPPYQRAGLPQPETKEDHT